MQVTRQNLKDIKEGLDPHLKTLGEKLGLELKWGRGTYGESGHLKIEIAAVSEEGHAMTPEAQAFKLKCRQEGLEPEDLWGTFTTTAGKTFQLVGYNVRAPKMPILAKSVEDGMTYKFRTGMFKGGRYTITREPATAEA